MDNEFKGVMSQRTDEELIKIVTIDREDYNPLAVEAAKSEIEKRNIDTNKIHDIKEKTIVENQQLKLVDSNVVDSGVRFLNFLIDFFAWLIIVFILTLPFNPDNMTHNLMGYFILFSTFIAYYSIMEIKFQKTLGKFVTKTTVVKKNGKKPENGEIIIRTLCRLIPFDRISFLITKNGIHDFLSKTTVTKDSDE